MYRIGCDIGGTFTDVVVLDTERGEVHAGKVLTTPDDPARAAIEGLRDVCAEQGIQLDREVQHLIHGTTLVINTLIQRLGAKTALLVTEGFRDFLEVGRGSRYDNYDIKAQILVASVRNPIHVKDAAIIGADIATCPYSVLKQLIKHPLTDSGMEKFLEDFKNSGQKPLV